MSELKMWIKTTSFILVWVYLISKYKITNLRKSYYVKPMSESRLIVKLESWLSVLRGGLRNYEQSQISLSYSFSKDLLK